MFGFVYTMFGYSALQRDDVASLLGAKPALICVIGQEDERTRLFDAIREHQDSAEQEMQCLDYVEISDEKPFATRLTRCKVDIEEGKCEQPLLVLASAPLTFCLRTRLAAFAKKRNALSAWIAQAELSPDWDTVCLGKDASQEQVAAVAGQCGYSVEALEQLRYGAEWLVLRRNKIVSGPSATQLSA